MVSTQVDAALDTRAVTRELDDRAKKLGSAEGALLATRAKKRHDDYLRMRRAASTLRADCDLDPLPRANPAAWDDAATATMFSVAQIDDVDASSKRGVLRVRLEHARDADALGTKAEVVDAAPPRTPMDEAARDAALGGLDAALDAADAARIRAALATALATDGCRSPADTAPDYAWVLRPLAVAARAAAALEAADGAAVDRKADGAALRGLASLRAEQIGRDGSGHAFFGFRGEREYNYAPHRVWVQRGEDAPPQPTAPLPCWGYFGDENAVRGLRRSLDETDASEAKLAAELESRLP